MKISTTRVLERGTSPRDILHRAAWSMAELDPELSDAIVSVVSELEAAETEVALLKLEAACKAASSAEQVMLPVRERPHLIAAGPHGIIAEPPYGINFTEDDRMPEGVILGLVSNG